jgi:hypothetical protein
LKFDKATIAIIQQLATVYVVEDVSSEVGNLHTPQTPENK